MPKINIDDFITEAAKRRACLDLGWLYYLSVSGMYIVSWLSCKNEDSHLWCERLQDAINSLPSFGEDIFNMPAQKRRSSFQRLIDIIVRRTGEKTSMSLLDLMPEFRQMLPENFDFQPKKKIVFDMLTGELETRKTCPQIMKTEEGITNLNTKIIKILSK
jgi:hypothetical protein